MKWPVLILTLSLTACQSGSEVSMICASIAREGGGAGVVHLHADGRVASIGTNSETERVEWSFGHRPDLLAELWRLAEPTIRATRNGDSANCGEVLTASVVVYRDADEHDPEIRQTTCTGNALHRLAEQILTQSRDAVDLPAAVETGADVPLLDACRRPVWRGPINE